MKTLKTMLVAISLGTILGFTSPASAQVKKDTSSAATHANGSGAGTGSSQGAPGSATVSGTGTGTLQDTGKGVATTPATAYDNDIKTAATGHPAGDNDSKWGLFGLFGLLGLLGFFKDKKVNS